MIIFVCSLGKLRSRTAELLCLFGGVYARACGTAPDAEAPVTDALLRQASLVVCMEGEHKKALADFQHYGAAPAVTLGIPDEFNRLEHALVRDLIYQMRFHNLKVAEAMERGYAVLSAQPGYREALGTHAPPVSGNPAFGMLPM